jgi:hypothetical protein
MIGAWCSVLGGSEWSIERSTKGGTGIKGDHLWAKDVLGGYSLRHSSVVPLTAEGCSSAGKDRIMRSQSANKGMSVLR